MLATVVAGCAHTTPAVEHQADVRHLGAIGDGQSHPLRERFASLRAARAQFPAAASLDDEIDTVAIQRAIDSGTRQVRIPAGTYLIAQPLRLRSHQHWVGAGMERTLLVLPSKPLPQAMPLATSTTNLQDIHIQAIGFRGNRDVQEASGSTAAFWIAAAVTNVTWKQCAFSSFGDRHGVSGGGIVIVPTARGTATRIEISGNRFERNTNIAGIYIGQEAGRDLLVRGNVFRGGGRQNFIYVTSEREGFTNVAVLENRITIDEPADTAIELTAVDGFRLEDNEIVVRERATGILLRDRVRRGVVARNKLHYEGPHADLTGIALVRHTRPGTGLIEEVSLQANEVEDFGGVAILIGAGSRSISLEGNRVHGRTRRIAQGIRIADARHVKVRRNQIAHVAHVRLACGSAVDSGLEQIDIAENEFVDVGAPGEDFIDVESTSCSTTALRLGDNVVRELVRGTRAFYSPR